MRTLFARGLAVSGTKPHAAPQLRGFSARTLKASMDDVREIFSVNYESAVHLAQSYIPRMIADNLPGHIMFTGSEHSVGLPAGNEGLNFGFYGASKHALLALAEWLRADLRESCVSVSLLMPGPVLTESLAATFNILETGYYKFIEFI